jgi:hypothetical protein
MEAADSLRQTLTHLFDAVRYSDHANDLEEASRAADGRLQADLGKLEKMSEEVSNMVSSLESESAGALKELAQQLEGFLTTAIEQAKEKLQRSVKEEFEGYTRSRESERDKALKSLEAFLATDPLPVIENLVEVRLQEGLYEAKSRCECEGGMKYEFRLAAHNTRLFQQEFALSQLGYELKVPVRFSRAILKKGRVPGFERLDQYILASAETSGGKIRASFQKADDGANLKVVTSGSKPEDFVGLEYSDQSVAVNVMNDPALTAHIDLQGIKKAMGDIVNEMTDLSKKKVALLKLTMDGEEPLNDVDYRRILQEVLKLLGPSYKNVIQKVSASGPKNGGGNSLSLSFIQERLKVLGELSVTVSQALGLQANQLPQG